jgi:hypothetical protein
MKKLIKPTLPIHVSTNLIYCLRACDYMRNYGVYPACKVFGVLGATFKGDKVIRHKRCRELT